MMKKTIIAGSRTIIDYSLLLDLFNSGCITWEITEVISGGAKGADKLGERWAKENNIPLKLFPAQWDKYGRRAGYLRNEKMAQYADALIALWDGKSRGTKHMLDLAKKYGLRVLWRTEGK